jgi:hypothetical protein
MAGKSPAMTESEQLGARFLQVTNQNAVPAHFGFGSSFSASPTPATGFLEQGALQRVPLLASVVRRNKFDRL